MPGRNFSSGNYRYGFNGKENDNEVKGEGNQYDYGFRIYDPRAGRFLSVDPLQKQYPELTPYQFSSNSPIDGIDLDGRERIDQRLTQENDGTTKLQTTSTGPAKERKLLTFWKLTKVPTFYRVEFNHQHYIFADPKDKSNVGVNYTDLATVYSLDDYQDFIKNPDADKYESAEEASSARVREQMIFNYKVLLAYGMTSYPVMTTPKGKSPNAAVNEQAIAANGGNTQAAKANTAPKTTTSPKFDPNKPALVKGNLNVPASKNGYSPDFRGTPYLYPATGNQKNIVQIKLTGSYSSDFSAANAAAGISGAKAPKGYTWHHLDDFNPSTGTATMQLVKSDVHTATIPHTGSVKQYEVKNNSTYKQ